MTATAVVSRSQKRYIVQYASTLASSDSAWETMPWAIPEEWSYGAGQVVGYAVITQDYGLVRQAGPIAVQTLGISPNYDTTDADSLCGRLVRICEEDSSGTVSYQYPYIGSGGRVLYETVNFTPKWWGVVDSTSRTCNGASDPGGQVTFTCSGLASILAKIPVDRGYAYRSSNGVLQIGQCPPFNPSDGSVSPENRSASTQTINGRTVYTFDYDTGGSGLGDWTYDQIADYLLASLSNYSYIGSTGAEIFPGFTWTRSGSVSTSTPTNVNLTGRSLLDALNYLINPRVGKTWNLTISGSTATINVFDLASGGTLSIEDDPWMSGIRLERDEAETYDIIRVTGNRPLVTATLRPADYEDGWTSDAETSWLANPKASGTQAVFRRFVLTGLEWPRDELIAGTSATQGFYGLTGDRSYDAGGSLSVQLQDCIQLYDGESSTTIPTLTSTSGTPSIPTPYTKEQGFEGPMVFVVISNVWTQLKDYSIKVEKSPPAIVIDDGADGLRTKALLDAGGEFYFTIGLSEPAPLQVSYVRDPSLWPRATPRVKSVRVQADEYAILNSTVIGVNAVGVAVDVGTGETIFSQVDEMNAVLARLIEGYAEPVYRLTFTDRGRALTSTGIASYEPGRTITTFDDGAAQIPINATIIRRTIKRVDNHYDTTVEAERLRRDIEAIL